MAYKSIGGSHIAYYDNTAKGVGLGGPAAKAPNATTNQASGFEALLKSAEQRKSTGKSASQSPPPPRFSPPVAEVPSPPVADLVPTAKAVITGNQTVPPPDAIPSRKASAAAATGNASPATRITSAERSHTVKPGDTVWELAVRVYNVDPKEIMALNKIGDPRKLQIGQTLRIPGKVQSAGKEEVVASWYGADHHGRPMANGDPFNMYGATIAHKELPLGTRVRLENPATGEHVIATVTDRGPYIAGRDVDLSYRLAQRLSLERQGVGSLTMEIL